MIVVLLLRSTKEPQMVASQLYYDPTILEKNLPLNLIARFGRLDVLPRQLD